LSFNKTEFPQRILGTRWLIDDNIGKSNELNSKTVPIGSLMTYFITCSF
jgi:hypothetical protein